MVQLSDFAVSQDLEERLDISPNVEILLNALGYRLTVEGN